ncbi:MAG: cobalamin B12-binding domain-containing protein [Actinobacteria bacterium]|nr:cobalamin B12-binding domain-containing protein [Actinomycetota bacterium]MDI6830551.1 cobalamin-dependent protein [Actinomycetota bacterium]
MGETLAVLLAELREDEALAEVRAALEEGGDPLSLVEGLREGMSEVGRRFEAGEYFLSELIMSAEIFKEAVALIEPHLQAGKEAGKGAVVIGTVKGDIHDIGKNIVSTLLRCEGFEVHDLGVDVEPAAFVRKLEETGARLLALSGLLTLAFDSMKETVEAVAEAGLRDGVKVILGGGPVNEKVVEYAGADAFGADAAQAVRLASLYLGA